MIKFIFILILFGSLKAAASDKDSTIYFNLPDSVKAVQFMSEITINSYGPKGSFGFELKTNGPSFVIQQQRFVFAVTELNHLNAGINTSFNLKDYGFVFKYDWKLNETYKFLISLATDSAASLTIYSGYIFLPRENKWKFMGSYPVKSWNPSFHDLSLKYRHSKKQQVSFTIGQTWVQRSSGSWKKF